MFENESNSTKIEIFVSNAGAYSAGTLTGEWFTLPVNNVNDIYKKISAKYGKCVGYDDEYFITDYNAPFTIHEADNISELNKLAKSFKNNHLNTMYDVYYSLNDRSKYETGIKEPVKMNEYNFDRLTAGKSKYESARMAWAGDFSYFDDYMRLDGAENLESLKTDEWLHEIDTFSDYIVDEYKRENNL